MPREIRMNDLQETLDELTYPVDRAEAAETFDGVKLEFADGEANLGELIAEVPEPRYDSTDELTADLHTTLPRSAVGEPYQSEGDA